jgi:DNA polymerase III epsilon subunit-like protein
MFLKEHLGLPVLSSHRAKDDSLATGHLYLALRDISSPRIKEKKQKKQSATTSNLIPAISDSADNMDRAMMRIEAEGQRANQIDVSDWSHFPEAQPDEPA